MGARRYYEKNGNKYAILKPKMQTEFTQMLALNTKTDVGVQPKPIAMLASNFKTTNDTSNIKFTQTEIVEKPSTVIASNYKSTSNENINGEVDYEELQKIETSNNVASNDYKIKEENVVIKSTEDINNQPIQTVDLNKVQKKQEIASVEKIAQAETKVETNNQSVVTPVEKIAQAETKVEALFPAQNNIQAETKIEEVNATQNIVKEVEISENKNSGYYVQVGKFQNKPDANFLNKIKAQGYAYTIMPISENGKIASKILIGPFDDTEAHGKLNSVKENIVKEAFITKIDS